MTSRSIRRVLDIDQDGDFELPDTSFNIPIATVWSPDGSFDSVVALTFGRVKSFVESSTPGAIARIHMTTRGDSLDVFESGGMGSIYLPPSAANPRPNIKIVGALVIGQQRVLVFGTPGTSFKIYQVDAAGQSSEASGTWTISASGQIRVDLKSPYLVAGSKIHAMTIEGNFKSAARAPLLQTTSSLLPPTSVLLEEGKGYVFYGDRLKANQQAFCVLADGTSIPLVTKWLKTTREIHITMPDLGSAGVLGPFNKLALVSIGLKNATTGVAKTQPVAVSLFYQ